MISVLLWWRGCSDDWFQLTIVAKCGEACTRVGENWTIQVAHWPRQSQRHLSWGTCTCSTCIAACRQAVVTTLVSTSACAEDAAGLGSASPWCKRERAEGGSEGYILTPAILRTISSVCFHLSHSIIRFSPCSRSLCLRCCSIYSVFKCNICVAVFHFHCITARTTFHNITIFRVIVMDQPLSVLLLVVSWSFQRAGAWKKNWNTRAKH